MTLVSAMNAAVSGLSAVARGVQVVSTNVANAATPEYGVRSVVLSSQQYSSGVTISNIDRNIDPSLLDLRQQANANAAGQGKMATFWQNMDRQVGNPEQDGALTSQISALSVAIQDAAANPESPAKLSNIRLAAQSVVQKIGGIETHVQAERTAADQSIAADIVRLNDGLQRIEALNKLIMRASAEGRDTLGLMDSRAAAVASISDIIPLKQITREGNRIELISAGGLVLLDHQPANFGFAPTRAIDAAMTFENSDLSGLTVNGRHVAATSRQIAGGALASTFQIRDTHATNVQAQLDYLAQDLVRRFTDPSVDPSILPDQPGLFTISSAANDAPPRPGSAGRLTVNPAIDPAKGGAEWRLRSGLGAPTPGPVGASALLIRLGSALEEGTVVVPNASSQSYLGNAAVFASFVGSSLYDAEQIRGYEAGKLLEYSELAARKGVDTDAEMQKLLRLEQAYAANARVIQSIDELMRQILEL